MAIAVHEGGHLIAAHLVGLHMGGISIGPLLISRSGNNWVFEFHRCLFGGYFKPLNDKASTRRFQYVVMFLGGPVSGFALAGLAGLLFARMGSGIWQWIGTRAA